MLDKLIILPDYDRFARNWPRFLLSLLISFSNGAVRIALFLPIGFFIWTNFMALLAVWNPTILGFFTGVEL